MTDNYLQLLHPLVCRWIGAQRWRDLHPIQKQAIIPVLEHKDDVIISASTAAGKTEAAFLPVLTFSKMKIRSKAFQYCTSAR